MKLLAGLGALGMLGGGLYASDALTAGAIYDKPYDQALTELESMPLSPIAGTGGGSGAVAVDRAAGTVEWRLSLGTAEIGRFTARLSPAGQDRTRVIVTFAPAPADPSTPTPIESSALMADFARLAMVEQVDARLENRPPDMRDMQWSMARHIQANPAQMREFGGAIDAQFQAVDKMLSEDSAEAAKFNERLKEVELNYGPKPSTEDATRPSVVFPGN